MSSAESKSSRRVVAVVPNLFFLNRIVETGRRVGTLVEPVEAGRTLESCRVAPPDLLIVDLEAPGDPIELVRALRAEPATSNVPIVAFYPHVRDALRIEAIAAGAHHVLPRSAFTRRLAELLAGRDVP